MAAKKPSKITYATIMVCVFTLAFFGVCTPQFTQVDLTGIVAEVNGEEISYHEFVRAYKRMSDSMRSRYGEDYDPASLQIASQTVDQLVKERIMSQQAQALGIRASDEEVVKYLARLAAFTDEKGQFSPEYMNSYLRANNYTEATFQEELRRSLSVSRLRDLLLYSTFASESRIEDEYLITENKLNVSYLKIPTSGKNSLVSSEEISRYVNDATQEEKLKSWYDSHTSDYQTEEEVKARHILISFEGARSASTAAAKRSKQEARSLAEKVLSMVTAEDADFNQIAKQNTDEPQGKDSGGDLGYFTREAMVKPFADVAFSLNKGQISDIVETDFGFHIIKKEDIKPAKNISYEDAKQDIAKKMLQKEKGPKEAQKQADAILAQLKSGQDTSETVKQYGLAWKNTGDFTLTARYISGLGSDASIRTAALSLHEGNTVYPDALESSGHLYILRLKSHTLADTSKLDEKRKEQIRSTLQFSTGYAFYSQFESYYADYYEKKKLIYKSPKYLALDAQHSPN